VDVSKLAETLVLVRSLAGKPKIVVVHTCSQGTTAAGVASAAAQASKSSPKTARSRGGATRSNSNRSTTGGDGGLPWRDVVMVTSHAELRAWRDGLRPGSFIVQELARQLWSCGGDKSLQDIVADVHALLRGQLADDVVAQVRACTPVPACACVCTSASVRVRARLVASPQISLSSSIKGNPAVTLTPLRVSLPSTLGSLSGVSAGASVSVSELLELLADIRLLQSEEEVQVRGCQALVNIAYTWLGGGGGGKGKASGGGGGRRAGGAGGGAGSPGGAVASPGGSGTADGGDAGSAAAALLRLGAVRCVLTALAAFPTSEAVQRHGITFLSNVAFRNADMLSTLLSQGCLANTLAAMETHLKSSGVQLASLQLLTNICGSDAGANAAAAVGVTPAILHCMDEHIAMAAVQAAAAKAVSFLCRSTVSKLAFALHRGVERLVTALHRHVDNTDVAVCACRALVTLAVPPDNQAAIAAAGGVAALHAVLSRQASERKVVKYALWCMRQLATNELLLDLLDTAGTAVYVSKAAERHRDNAVITEHAQSIMEVLAPVAVV
jgi:hypothetical protein